MKHKKSELLWPTQIFHYSYENWANDKDVLVNYIYKQVEQQEKPIDSQVAAYIKKNLKESKFNFLDSTNIAVRNLRYFIRDCLTDMYKNQIQGFDEAKFVDFDPNVFESWYHVANNGGSHGFHVHAGVDWAGIFYAQVGDCDIENNNGINRFYNFNTMVHGNGYGSQYWHGKFHYDFQPVEGDLVLFPGWIPHEATPYTGDKDRIVISVNSQFKRVR